MYGKTLKFCSHGTGGLAQSVDIITEALPDSTISENVFDCYEQDASSSQQDIESWLSELGILKTFVKIKKRLKGLHLWYMIIVPEMQF